MKILSKERIEHLLWGAQHEMVHGDYVPNIPERVALCEMALMAFKFKASLQKIKAMGCDLNAECSACTAYQALTLWDDL